MNIERCATAEEFLDATVAYRDADPIRTNVLASVAASMAEAQNDYDVFFWWLLREGGDVVGGALRTPPFGLGLGPMSEDTARALAPRIAEDDDEFPWVAGPEAPVAAFLDAYGAATSTGSGRRVTNGRRSLLYELGELNYPNVGGSCRQATLDDVDLVARWTADFHLFVDGVARHDDERNREYAKARVASGSMYLWCVNDIPVAMAGHALPVATPSALVTRIGPVYTPEELRGRGYGTAITAWLSELLLGTGSRVMLYADADYPTSNAVYQRLGFESLDQVVQFDLAAPGVAAS
jgi:GNAT superfamily N-acetyltransferase